MQTNENLAAIISDTHSGVRGSSQVFIDYQRRFYSAVFFPYLAENGIKRIFHGGDFFDNRKTIDLKALHANRKMFLEPLVENGIHMTIIPGNHDTRFNDTNRVCSLKELLGYYTENVSILMDPTEIRYNGKTRILWLPWINQENRQEALEAIKRSKANILIGHLELSGFDVYRGVPAHSGMESGIFNKFKMVLTGHYHTKSKKGNVSYLGSQMEFTWGDCDDQKYFHVLNLETHELTEVPNPIKIYKRVKYDSRTRFTDPEDYRNRFVKIVIEEKPNSYEFDRFVEEVERSEPLDVSVTDSTTYGDFTNSSVSLLNEEEVQTASEDILTFIGSYVDGIEETSLDKSRMKTLMNSIFREAELLEVN